MAADHRQSGYAATNIYFKKYVYVHTHINYLTYFGLKSILNDKIYMKYQRNYMTVRKLYPENYIKLKCPICPVTVN